MTQEEEIRPARGPKAKPKTVGCACSSIPINTILHYLYKRRPVVVERLLLGADGPLEAEDEGDLAVDGVGGEETLGGALGGGEEDLGVDVQGLDLSARSPNGGGEWDLVVDEVVLGDWALELGLGGSLLLETGEVVGGPLGGSDTGIDTDVSTVVGGEERVLEALRIVEVDVDLAVLAGISGAEAGADRGVVLVEEKSEGLLVGGERDTDGSLRTSSSTVGDTSNVNLRGVGLLSRDERAEGENTGGEDSGELHFELRLVGSKKEL